jgi:hypothetical protein
MWAGMPHPSAGVPLEAKSLCRSGFGPANAKNAIVMEAETKIDLLGEIADLDPDFDDLVERCCEWLARDLVQHDHD